LAPPGDVDALAGALGRLLRNPLRREAMGSTARDFCLERFDVRKWAPRYRELYEAVVG
jgi:glycosyltransferase involved in cell wall biosynthesis